MQQQIRSNLLSRWRLITDMGEATILTKPAADECFQGLDITFYDLRLLDPGNNTIGIPTSTTCLFFHKNCVIGKFGQAGFICTNDYVLVTDEDVEKRSICEDICRRVKFIREIHPSHIQHDSSESFIATVIDTIIDDHSARIRSRVTQLQSSISALLKRLERSVDAIQFATLKTFKSRINSVAKNIETLIKTLDIALTDPAGEPGIESDNRDNLKMLLYSHQVRATAMHGQTDQIIEDINDSENFFNMRVDAQRNQILRFDLIMTTVSFSIGIISAVSGLLGMNLDNASYMPAKKNSFIYVSVFLCVSAFAAFILCCLFFVRVGIF